MTAEKYIANAHPAFIDKLYKEYKENQESVEQGWRKFFEGFDFALKGTNGESVAADAGSLPEKELRVYSLIYTYRVNGHLVANTNPVRERKDRAPHLNLSDFGLEDSDLQQRFVVSKAVGLSNASLTEIIEKLRLIYTKTIGVEYQYIRDPEERHWFRDQFENIDFHQHLTLEKKKRILRKLNKTVGLEKFLGTKYLGAKRFSLEGGESTIPAIDELINKSAELGVKEVIIGMAHRGRLNVLANILRKTYDQIFNEFEGNEPDDLTMGDGDVKYHLGFASQKTTPQGNDVYVRLVPNPSHLEAVDPVVEGFARAKADVVYNSNYDQILPILIHGDAAIAGQGIVYEVAQMSKLKGYYTGGTIHFVINNQIGFTTDFDDARSSDYCTSVAGILQAPVIHVNGDDPEAVVFACDVAAKYRCKYNKDVFIDMVCYRRHGHNEADDPKYTQPQLYSLIAKHKNPRDLYVDRLMSRGDIEAEMAKKMDQDFWKDLQDRLDNVKQKPLPYEYQEPELAWKALRKSTPNDFDVSPKTAISKTKIATIVKGLIKVPDGFTPLRKVDKMLEERRKLMRDNKTIDWAGAELLAYGSILLEGKNVRLSGQDVKRGTFSHRHAVLTDEKTGESYNRLDNLQEKQGRFMIYNSLLSEFGVLGFEFGYSIASPDHLVIWEAQFGDFANGAQSMIDQFVTTSESKWQKMSGLVMLLPHGYEGQGPEHSSARLERFLQSCAEYNISVCNITSPSNFFHALRRQLARPFRKPLVVMSPKSLLRHPRCISSIDEISGGGFQELLETEAGGPVGKVRKVIVCSGKIYYDLLIHKEEIKNKDIVILRLEQLYPFPKKQFEKAIKRYKNAELLWVQEEPENYGGWTYILNTLRHKPISVVARKASASPATGYKKVHLREQQEIIEKAFS